MTAVAAFDAPRPAGDERVLTADLPQLGQDPSRTYRLGVMGGTFDPIHNGHLVAAEQAAVDLDLDVVVFVPAGSPAFKQDKRVTSPEMRYDMALLATADNPRFLVSRIEVDRAGITYTVDTLELLRAHYPANVEIYFITGADAILDILAWRDAARIAGLAKLVGATRPGYDLEAARGRIAASGLDFQVHYLEVPALAISSSDLRARVAAGNSLRYLTPDPVVGFVGKRGLYGGAHKGYVAPDALGLMPGARRAEQ